MKPFGKICILSLCFITQLAHALVDGFKGIEGISPDPLGFSDASCTLSKNGSLLVLGHTNGSVLFFYNNGTDFIQFQRIDFPRYTDCIRISANQE